MDAYSILKQTLESARQAVRRKLDRRPIHIPSTAKEKRGRVLFSYLADPLRLPLSSPPQAGHPNQNRARVMVQEFLAHGYDVDVIDYRNHSFRPARKYDVLFDIHYNLHRLSGFRGMRYAFKILFSTGNPPDYSNAAERSRVHEFNLKYGVNYRPQRQVDSESYNRAIDVADLVIAQGARACLHHFAPSVHAKLMWIPPFPALYHPNLDKLPELQKLKSGFLWLNGPGAIFKGADRAIEAFAEMPDRQLHLVGGCLNEDEFGAGICETVSASPNVFLYGHQDLRSFVFQTIAEKCSFALQTSCSEAPSTATISLMHMGMIPIVTPHCCLAFPPGLGYVLDRTFTSCELRTICSTLSTMNSAELLARRRRVQEYARKHYTVRQLRSAFGSIVCSIGTNNGA